MALKGLLLALLIAGAPVDSPLQVFDFLAGSCWQGTFANGAVDTRCVSWIYGGSHVRDVHVARGEDGDYCGETIYSVDADGEISFRYFNSLGGVSEGRMIVDNDVLMAPETYVGRDGRERKFRNTLRPLDAMSYEAMTQEWQDGEWQEVSRVVFTRVGNDAAKAILNSGCSAG